MKTPSIIGSLVGTAQGLTLVEAVIAMGLVFLVLLALSGLAVTASKGAAASKHLTTATTLGQDKLEEWRTAGSASSFTNPIETTEEYAAIPDYPLYKREWRVLPNQPVPGLHAATVTVWWADDRHSVSFSTILAP